MQGKMLERLGVAFCLLPFSLDSEPTTGQFEDAADRRADFEPILRTAELTL